MALFALYSHQKIEFFRKLGFFSQPDVSQLGEVADFEALTFNLELNFF